MRTLNILQFVGYISLLLGSIFNLVNSVNQKTVFPLYIIILLFLIALVGIVCGIVVIVKNKK